MKCNDIAAVLDTHRSARLSPVERACVDAHLAACEDCTAAWHAQNELLALRMPAMPATLLERAVLGLGTAEGAPMRRVRMPVVIGSVLLAGAAAAAVTIVAAMREQAAPSVSPVDIVPRIDSSGVPLNEIAKPPNPAPTPLPGDGVTSVELVETALSLAPIVRRPPDYPPAALAQGLEGQVRLKFDVTAAGSVENLSVEESSDVQFEEAALLSVSEWRYLPRIVAGKRIATEGVQTVIRFALSGEPVVPDARRDRELADARREALAFSAGLEVALDRLAADDLRGAELELDEMQALYGADRFDLWNFYGYLYTVQADYGRAIAAYETAVAISARAGGVLVGPFVPLANLYFARHQYDLALKTLAAYRDRIAAAQAENPGRPVRPLDDEAARLYERLRALGVTDGSL